MSFSKWSIESTVLAPWRIFRLGRHKFSNKPPWILLGIIFSRLTSISFYVSSRCSGICIMIERIRTISIHRAAREDNFTVQALMHWIFDSNRFLLSISSFNSIDLTCRMGNRVHWIECRSQIIDRSDHSRHMEDLVFEVPVFQKHPPRSHQ
jgi:hypothetical protein